MFFKVLVQMFGKRQRKWKEIEVNFDHKITVLHSIYTLAVSSFSWQIALSNKDITFLFRQRQLPCFAVMGHILIHQIIQEKFAYVNFLCW